MTRAYRRPDGFSGCRIPWRPSLCLQLALGLMAGLATVSIWLSEMPVLAASLASPVSLLWGARLIWRERRKQRHELVVPAGDLPILLDGQALEDAQLDWRGPMAFLSWKQANGKVVRLNWWPDTLPAARRRELRLATGQGKASRWRQGMAP